MTMPSIPPGRAPVPATMRTEVAAVRQRLDELARGGPLVGAPVCRVVLAIDAALSANTNVFAQNNWVVGTNAAGTSEDPDRIATLSTTLGTNSFITIPRSGRYWVRTRAVFTSPAAAGTCVAFVCRGVPDTNVSILRDPRNTTSAGGDGTVCKETRDVYLQRGDVLYWGHWSSVAVTLAASRFGVPTEVSLNWIGTR